MTIKEKVAELPLRHRGEYISGEEMARGIWASAGRRYGRP